MFAEHECDAHRHAPRRATLDSRRPSGGIAMGKKLKTVPIVRLKPSIYQASKAEMEDDIRLPGGEPEDLIRVVMRDVDIEYEEDA